MALPKGNSNDQFFKLPGPCNCQRCQESVVGPFRVGNQPFQTDEIVKRSQTPRTLLTGASKMGSRHETPPTGPLVKEKEPEGLQRQIALLGSEKPLPCETINTAKMLVIPKYGEQRIVTFRAPMSVCKIQMIMKHVGVPFTRDITIQRVLNPDVNFDYVATVGKPAQELLLRISLGQPINFPPETYLASSSSSSTTLTSGSFSGPSAKARKLSKD